MDSLKIKQRLGRNTRAIRQMYGLTLEDVAKVARASLGKSWTGNYLADIESGRGGSTVEHVVTVAMALSEAAGEPVTVQELISGPGLLEITPWIHVKPERLADILAGGDARLQPGDRSNSMEGAAREFARIFGGVDGVEIDAASWTLADERARKKIGIDKDQFIKESIKLWGNLLSVETENRAGENANAQKKGIVTRKLINELQESLQNNG
jgi:transcriptional regulator with XRE-family HTH domain